jgi:cytochrome b6-f complex iron-sulfur subunit
MFNDLSRRYFLKVIAVGAATSAGALTACSGPSNTDSQALPIGDVKAGNVSALAVGEVRPVPGVPAFIGRDVNGVYAMTTTCTHLGCDLAMAKITATYIECPCHQSQFDYNGGVVQGPAASPLVHYAVEVAADGTLTIHGGTTVAASTRTAVA